MNHASRQRGILETKIARKVQPNRHSPATSKSQVPIVTQSNQWLGNSSRLTLHIIGERPGTMHHAYSVYITVAKGRVWAEKKIDHDITKLVSNVADTALPPKEAARETLTIIREIVGKNVDGSRRLGA